MSGISTWYQWHPVLVSVLLVVGAASWPFGIWVPKELGEAKRFIHASRAYECVWLYSRDADRAPMSGSAAIVLIPVF
jgi:hypothetical protein